jgi:hypothetical protein
VQHGKVRLHAFQSIDRGPRASPLLADELDVQQREVRRRAIRVFGDQALVGAEQAGRVLRREGDVGMCQSASIGIDRLDLVRFFTRATHASTKEARRGEVIAQQPFMRSDVRGIERGCLVELALYAPGESRLADRVGAGNLFTGRATKPEMVDRNTGFGLYRFLEFLSRWAPFLFGDEPAAGEERRARAGFAIYGGCIDSRFAGRGSSVIRRQVRSSSLIESD